MENLETKIKIENYLNNLKNYLKDEKFKSESLVDIFQQLDHLFFMANFCNNKKKENFLDFVGSEDWEKINHTIEYSKVRLIKAIANL
jgi:hypothetical protein